MPDRLEPRVIMAGLGRVYERANTCVTTRRELRITIAISPEGTVSNLVVRPATELRLVECVTAAYEGLAFPRSKQGGAFNFVLALGDPAEPAEPAPGDGRGSGDPVAVEPSAGKMVTVDKPTAPR